MKVNSIPKLERFEMIIETIKVDVCTTCHLAAAGFDSHELGLDNDDFNPWSKWSDEKGHPVAGTETSWFSSFACEGCGSEAGDRFEDLWVVEG